MNSRPSTRGALVAAAALLGGAPAATALSFRAANVVDGPVLAGRTVAWAEAPGEAQSAAVQLRRGRRIRTVARFRATTDGNFLTVHLAASARRIAYEVDESEPAHGDSIPVAQSFGTATLSGATQSLLRCGAFTNGGIGVSGDVVMIGRPPDCSGSAVELRDLAHPGPPSVLPTHDHEATALAGSYVAWTERAFQANAAEADVVFVASRLTARIVYHVSVPGRQSLLGLATDGKVAIAYESGTGGPAKLVWSATDGRAHPLRFGVDTIGGRLLIARGRIAVPLAVGDEGGLPAVIDLRGRVLRRVRGDSLATRLTDFDGTRLAWREDSGTGRFSTMHVG